MTKPSSPRRSPSAQQTAQPRDPHRRSQVMATRVTPLEQHHIMAAAFAVQLSPSDFLRRAALGQTVTATAPKPVPTVKATYVPLVRELNAVGVNLNQLTRIGNASGYVPAGLDQLLAEINRLLDKLMDLERMS